jgi:hypothetical protein
MRLMSEFPHPPVASTVRSAAHAPHAHARIVPSLLLLYSRSPCTSSART